MSESGSGQVVLLLVHNSSEEHELAAHVADRRGSHGSGNVYGREFFGEHPCGLLMQPISRQAFVPLSGSLNWQAQPQALLPRQHRAGPGPEGRVGCQRIRALGQHWLAYIRTFPNI